MKVGEFYVFLEEEFNNAFTTVGRLNEAYEGKRQWERKTRGRVVTVTRIK